MSGQNFGLLDTKLSDQKKFHVRTITFQEDKCHFPMYRQYLFACNVQVIILYILYIFTSQKRDVTMLKFLSKSVPNLFWTLITW